MNINEFSLNQLLELGLRYPEIGAVNFNVLYLILKTIIKKQGLETLTPACTQEITEDEKDADTDSKSSDHHDKEEITWNLKRFTDFEEELRKLNEVVENLTTTVSDLEARPVQSNNKEAEKTSKGDKESRTWRKGELLRLKMNSLKNELESLQDQGTELEQIFLKMESLQASNDYIVDRFEELLQDFDTVMNGYSKLDMKCEELENEVSKKIRMEDDVDKLKEQMDKLETYAYTGKYKPVEKGKKGKIPPVEEKSYESVYCPHYMIGRAEVQQKTKGKKAFAKVVNDLMNWPDERKGNVVHILGTEPTGKRAVMKKNFEEFIKMAQETRKMKDEVHEAEAIEVQDDEEEATDIPISQLQQEAELDASELVEEESSENIFQGAARKKLLNALHIITLTKGMQKAQQAARISKAHEKEALESDSDTEDEEQQASSEIFEIHGPPSEQVSAEVAETKHEKKATLLSEDDSALRELKEQIVLYVKSRLEEIESLFMDNIKKLETSTIGIEEENAYWRNQMIELTSRLVALEKNEYKSEERLMILEKKVKTNYLCIQDMMRALDKKADTTDNFGGRKEMSALEDRTLQMHETTSLEIDDLKNFLKEYVLKLRNELDEKVSGFDVDLRMERIAGRLKILERVVKEISLKVRFLQCQCMGPIEIKRYLHCEDGRRIKPIQKALNLCTSATRDDLCTAFDDKLFEENIADQIEADVQQRLEDVIMRESKRYISGAHAKMKSTRI